MSARDEVPEDLHPVLWLELIAQLTAEKQRQGKAATKQSVLTAIQRQHPDLLRRLFEDHFDRSLASVWKEVTDEGLANGTMERFTGPDGIERVRMVDR